MVVESYHSETKINRVETLCRKNLVQNYQNTDKTLAIVMVLQWIGAIILANFLSPLTWEGSHSSIHPHVYSAIIFGGALTATSGFLALFHPGATVTRYIICVNQLLMSSLLIHVTDGRATTHFHIFVSLAFLAGYRDWKVFIPVTLIIAGDHVFRGMIYPQSIFGITTVEPWLIVEHAVYVIFEDVILVLACLRSVNETRASAEREVEVLESKKELEQRQSAIEKFAAESEEQKQYLSNSVEKILAEMSKFSDGDLRARLDKSKEDKIGELFDGFNLAVENTGGLLRRVTETVKVAAAASNQISFSTQALAANINEQSAQSLEITTEASAMKNAAAQSDEFIKLTLETAGFNGEAAKNGQEIVCHTLDKIGKLAETVKSSTDCVERLSKSSDEIGKILKVIHDIANQTNLLALNAAIEAARAGEHGASFSVVATQVRMLAGDTQSATQQISSIMEAIQTEICNASKGMQTSLKEVEEGLNLTEKTSDALKKISGESAKLLDRVNKMAEISGRQNISTGNVAESVWEISKAATDSADSITEIAASSSQLTDITEILRLLTSQFKFETANSQVKANKKIVDGKTKKQTADRYEKMIM